MLGPHIIIHRAAAPSCRMPLNRAVIRPLTVFKPVFSSSKLALINQQRYFTITSSRFQNEAPRVTEKQDSKHPKSEIFLEAKTPNIKKTHTAWPHPQFDENLLRAEVHVAHRPTSTFGDKIAYNAVRFFKYWMNTATGYRENAAGDADGMTERKWLIRIVFLESVAGVPGMVAGMLRHLHSLRRLKRDNGWIETLLEEAFNERVHLLTFLKLTSPGLFMRTMILGAQGVFFNGFFLAYLISPSICHRFVGYLEEEAVRTYTKCIADLESGKLPLWENMEAPEMAVEYWNMPVGKRGMKDLLYHVRADEAKHREVNHTLGNLDQHTDPNPFVSEWKDDSKPHPSRGLKGNKATGWERKEAL